MIEAHYARDYVPNAANHYGRYRSFLALEARKRKLSGADIRYEYLDNGAQAYGEGQLWLSLDKADREAALDYPPSEVVPFMLGRADPEKLEILRAEIDLFAHLSDAHKKDWMSMLPRHRRQAAKMRSRGRLAVFIDVNKGAVVFDPRKTDPQTIIQSWKLFD